MPETKHGFTQTCRKQKMDLVKHTAKKEFFKHTAYLQHNHNNQKTKKHQQKHQQKSKNVKNMYMENMELLKHTAHKKNWIYSNIPQPKMELVKHTAG